MHEARPRVGHPKEEFMIRLSPLLVALGLAVGIVVSLPAAGQAVSRGATLYAAHCTGCHGTNPRNDPHAPWGARLGAGNPTVVIGSFDEQSMKSLRSRFVFPADANDLAAYLGSVFQSSPPPAAGRLTLPSPGSFAGAAIGSMASPQAFTLGNAGSGSLKVTRVTSSNPSEFAIAFDTCTATTLPPGGNCTVGIGFAPSAIGARSATISVANDGSTGTQSFAVYGTGAPPLVPVAPTTPAVEYVHAGTGHFFVTATPAEIAALDAGGLAGWSRTGLSFTVYADAAGGGASVCRFYTAAFPPASAHFYASSEAECEALKRSGDWTFEGKVFATLAPAADGSCAAATLPVYRLYNNGLSGAPNHRYTTDLGVRAAMIALGHTPEGAGMGVSWCVPQ
jgi:hypothetical protein